MPYLIHMKSRYLLAQNIRALQKARGTTDAALAMFCGHSGAWLSKILKLDGDPRDHRECSYTDLDKIADFFGLTVADLFSHGIAPKLERRVKDRRQGNYDRRRGERRQQSAVDRLYGQIPPWRPKVR